MCFSLHSIESHSGHRCSITKHFQDGLHSPTTGWNVFFALTAGQRSDNERFDHVIVGTRWHKSLTSMWAPPTAVFGAKEAQNTICAARVGSKWLIWDCVPWRLYKQLPGCKEETWWFWKKHSQTHQCLCAIVHCLFLSTLNLHLSGHFHLCPQQMALRVRTYKNFYSIRYHHSVQRWHRCFGASSLNCVDISWCGHFTG